MKKEDWTRFISTFEVQENKRVESINIEVVARDFTGQVNITDVQLQGGESSTGSIINEKEFLNELKGPVDETITAVDSADEDRYDGDEPNDYGEVSNRFFNIVGRGHESFTIPNVFETNYAEDVLPTELDLTLYAKDDYDLLRISSHYGTEVDDFDKPYDHEVLQDHPLNKRYSRSFIFVGGSEGDEIKLIASEKKAEINGVTESRGVRDIEVDDFPFRTSKQRFLSVPHGSARIRVEFYRVIEREIEDEWGNVENLRYLDDAGIGYQGLAEIKQWTTGGSKL